MFVMKARAWELSKSLGSALLWAVVIVVGVNLIAMVLGHLTQRVAAQLTVLIVVLVLLVLLYSAQDSHLGLSENPTAWLRLATLVAVIQALTRSKGAHAEPEMRSPESELARRVIPQVLLGCLFIALLLAFVAVSVFHLALWITRQLSALAPMSVLERENFTVSLVLVLACFSYLLVPSVFRRQSWKKLGDPILKWTGISALTVGGFGLVGLTDKSKNALLLIATSKSQLSETALERLYAMTIALAVLAALLRTVGTAASEDDDSRSPFALFVPAFLLGWTSAVGVFTLTINGTLLTLLGHWPR